MAKKKTKTRKKKIITKDAGYGIGVPVSSSPTSSMVGGTNTPQSNVVQTPPPQTSAMYWPAPTRWYQEGKEATKKAIIQYVNDANQLQAETDQERKMQLIGKMNNQIQYIIQGIAIATEAAELQSQRKRTGDQAAVFELAVTEDTLKRLLKILWAHNLVAKRSAYPGLEIKLLESQLTGRINRTTSLKTNDDGIEIELDKGEDPRLLWQVDYTPPAPGQQGPAEPTTSAPPTPPGASQPPPQPGETPPANPPAPTAVQPSPEQGAALPQQPPPEITQPSAEATPAQEAEVATQQPLASASPAEGTSSEEETLPTSTMEEPSMGIQQQNQAEVATGGVSPDLAERERLVAEREAAVAQREAAVAQREAALLMQKGEAEEDYEDEESSGPGGSEEPSSEEQPPAEEESDSDFGSEDDESEDEDEDEDDVRYCIECNREVSKEERLNCDNPKCPFRTQEVAEGESQDTPSRVPEAAESEEGGEEEYKHFVMMDTSDHSTHRLQKLTLKEYEGVVGEYCLDCQKLVSYSFDDTWDSIQVKGFVDRHIQRKECINKTPEDLVKDSLDHLSDEEILALIEEKAHKRTSDDLFGELYSLGGDELNEIVQKSVAEGYKPLTTKVSQLGQYSL